MLKKVLKSQIGQTALEYVLMLAVVTSIALTFFKKMDQYLLSNPDSIFSKPLNSYKKMLTGDGDTQAAYRRFSVRKAPSNH